MSSICAKVDRADVISLHHTSRQIMVASADAFNKALESLTITCSVAGLNYLQTLVAHCDENEQCLSRVTHVTIHTLTPSSLCELAHYMDYGQGDPYVRLYALVCTVLIESLNVLPNLNVVTTTNKDFNGTPEVCIITPKTLPAVDSLNGTKPRLHAFECALSVLPHLRRKDLELNLILDQDNDTAELLSLPVLLEHNMPLQIQQ
jgi:hypothetical protein